MISIWHLVNDSWELVEEMTDDLALAQRISELRQDGSQYRAEKREAGFSSILEV
jgi:hypothetical protein